MKPSDLALIKDMAPLAEPFSSNMGAMATPAHVMFGQMVRNGRAGEEFMGDKHDKPFHVIQLDNGGYVVVAAMTQRWTENFLPPKEMVIDVFDDEPQPFVAMTERLPNGEKGRRFLNMNILHVRPPG